MTEFVILAVLVLLADVLLGPLRRRMAVPPRVAALRSRPRRRVLLEIWGATAALLAVLWLIGERRGVLNGLLLALWIGGPLAAIRLTLYLRRPGT